MNAEKRSVELFGFPLVAAPSWCSATPGRLSPYAQARTVVRALAVDRGQAGDVDPILGAIPVTNTLGLFPGCPGDRTTSLTYLLLRRRRLASASAPARRRSTPSGSSPSATTSWG